MKATETKNCDSHVILYAKGWYKRGNTLKDLKIIYGHRNGVDPKYIRDMDILNMLSNLVYDSIGFDRYSLGKFLKECFTWPMGSKRRKTVSITQVVECLLSMLYMLRIIKDHEILVPLDKPDYTILPAREDY